MNQKLRLVLLGALASSPVWGAPFLAIGDNAELFVTASSEIRHESNVTLSSTNTRSDEIFEIVPGFEITFGKTSLTRGSFSFNERLVAYSDNTRFNSTLTNVNFNSVYEGAKLTFSTNASYRESNQANRDLAFVNSLIESSEFSSGFRGELALTEKTKIATGVGYNDFSYETAGLSDRKTYTVPVDYYFAIRPKIDLSVGLQYRYTDVQLGADTTDLYYNIGARGEFTPKLIGSFSIGYNQRDTKGGSDDTLLGLKTGLAYYLTPKTQFSLDLSNDFDTGGLGTGQEVAALTLGASTALNTVTTLRTSISYQDISYVGGRKDDFWIYNLSGSYTYNQHLSFNAGYSYMKNESNAAISDFTNHTVSLSARFRY